MFLTRFLCVFAEGPGSSSNPCAANYHGAGVGSELETQAVKAKAEEIRAQYGDGFIGWLAMHTHGRWVFTPYGNGLPPAYDTHLVSTIMNVCTNPISVNNVARYALFNGSVSVNNINFTTARYSPVITMPGSYDVHVHAMMGNMYTLFH